MPNSAARAFMRSTNASSLPATASAKTTVASFALITTHALMRSSTVICSPSLSQMSEPPMPAACAEAVSTSSRCSVPASIASNTSKSVITFVMDAQGRCTWADFSYNT